MITIFRKIRQKLLNERLLSKYFFYAVGEIFLVVVGILIALQVNNWNLQRKDTATEQSILKSLKDEFNYNLEELNKVIDLNLANSASAKKLVLFQDQEMDKQTEKEFAILYTAAFKNTSIFHPSPGILNETINSGKLALISNEELRKMLASWESKLELIKDQEQLVNAARKKCHNHLLTNGNFRSLIDLEIELNPWYKLPPGKSEILNINAMHYQSFENDLVFFIAAAYFLDSFYAQDLKAYIESILNLIKKEIK